MDDKFYVGKIFYSTLFQIQTEKLMKKWLNKENTAYFK